MTWHCLALVCLFSDVISQFRIIKPVMMSLFSCAALMMASNSGSDMKLGSLMSNPGRRPETSMQLRSFLYEAYGKRLFNFPLASAIKSQGQSNETKEQSRGMSIASLRQTNGHRLLMMGLMGHHFNQHITQPFWAEV